jgi:hypothetical protein
MKKAALALLLVLALAGPVFAEGFVKSEADRSGTTGTLAMIGNSISGFFSSLGKLGQPKTK